MTDVNGRFIVFEGGEGSGKSTQARLLAGRLGARLTHEPGGTAIGGRLRELLLDPATAGLDVLAEALLMAADRAQHVAEVIVPALAAGRHVVSDRFTGSSLAYQGYGRGLDLALVRQLSTVATGGLEPDVTILLSVSPEVAAARRTRPNDRFEATAGGFHDRVRAGYDALASADPERWVVVNGEPAADDVAAAVALLVEERLARMGA